MRDHLNLFDTSEGDVDFTSATMGELCAAGPAKALPGRAIDPVTLPFDGAETILVPAAFVSNNQVNFDPNQPFGGNASALGGLADPDAVPGGSYTAGDHLTITDGTGAVNYPWNGTDTWAQFFAKIPGSVLTRWNTFGNFGSQAWIQIFGRDLTAFTFSGTGGFATDFVTNVFSSAGPYNPLSSPSYTVGDTCGVSWSAYTDDAGVLQPAGSVVFQIENLNQKYSDLVATMNVPGVIESGIDLFGTSNPTTVPNTGAGIPGGRIVLYPQVKAKFSLSSTGGFRQGIQTSTSGFFGEAFTPAVSVASPESAGMDALFTFVSALVSSPTTIQVGISSRSLVDLGCKIGEKFRVAYAFAPELYREFTLENDGQSWGDIAGVLNSDLFESGYFYGWSLSTDGYGPQRAVASPSYSNPDTVARYASHALRLSGDASFVRAAGITPGVHWGYNNYRIVAGSQIDINTLSPINAAQVLFGCNSDGRTSVTIDQSFIGTQYNNTSADPVTVTVPAGIVNPFDGSNGAAIIEISQGGAGQVTVAAGAGVQINSLGGKMKTSGQFAVIRLYQQSGNTWLLSGDLAA